MKHKITAAISAICLTASVFAQLSALGADNVTYTFSGTNIITDGSANDITDVKLTDTITATTSGDMNRKYVAVTDLEHNKDVGTFPISESFQADGSYIYLSCANANDNTIITLNLPVIPAGSEVTLTFAKPTITNNGSTLRNTNDPYAYFKIADRCISINGDDFDTWRTETVVTGEDTDAIEFRCDQWGSVAVSKIEIKDGTGTPLHSVTINSTQYASLKVNGIKFSSDETGSLTVPSLPEGESVTISASKDGYLENETTVTVSDTDLTVDLPLECATDAVYYESDFGNSAGTLTFDSGETGFTPFELGGIEIRPVTKIYGRLTFNGTGNLSFVSGSRIFMGIQYIDGDGIFVNDSYLTSKDNIEFEAVTDRSAGQIYFTQNGSAIGMEPCNEFDTLDRITGSNVTIEYIGVSYPDKNDLRITGPDKVSSVAEGRTFAEFTAEPAYLIPGVQPVFSVEEHDGVTITADGNMIVTDGLDAGTVTVCVDYDGAKAYKTVEIVPNPEIGDFELNAPDYLNLYTTAQISLKYAADEYGNRIEIPLRNFAASKDSPVVLSSDGRITATGTASAVISFEAYTGSVSDKNKLSITLNPSRQYIVGTTDTAAAYVRNDFTADNIDSYLITFSDGTQETIESSDIPAAAAVSDGTVIVASYDTDGNMMSAISREVQTGELIEVSDAAKKVYFNANGEFSKITEADAVMPGFKIEHTAGVQYEIDPVYKITEVGDTAEEKTLLPSCVNGYYDITFKKSETARGDIYINGTMVGNNVDQADADRKVTEGSLYTAEDIKIEDGSIRVSMCDGSTQLDYVTITKKPVFYERQQRVYVIGDSLACIYYGSFEQEVGGGRAGWGQQLPDFLKVPVTNLANSGQYAAGLYETAFPGVIANAEEGDILLIECAYNDRSYSTREEMDASIKSMIRECRENGIIPILVTPNASAHDYKPSVVWTSYMKDDAVDTDCQLIDLAKKSYDFLYAIYGDDADGNITKNFNLTEVGGDTLHSSYAGAYVWASVVAQGLKDLGYGDIVNSSFTYSFTDTLGNRITAEIK